jgi:hypothetical protein
MSEIKYARLLNKRGLRQSLPQPLMPGQFGLCVDTDELFIGKDTSFDISDSRPIIDLQSILNGTEHANYTIQNYIFQVNLTDPSIDFDDVVAANDNNVTSGFSREFLKVGNKLFVGYVYKYVGGNLTNPVLPGMGLGTEQTLFNAIMMQSFDLFSLDLTAQGYTFEEAGAIATLINYSFADDAGNKPGLVNIRQNLKVITEKSDVYPQTLKFSLPASAVYAPTGVSYSKTLYQSLVINYSVYNDASNFLQTGTLLVSALSGIATVAYTDSNSGAINGPAANFQIRAVSVGNNVEVQYLSLINLQFKMVINKWNVES